MPRPVTTAVELYGQVRIKERNRGCRVLWQHGGRRHERTAPTLERARAIALAQAARLNDPNAPLNGDAPLALVLAAWLEPDVHPSWTPNFRRDMVSATRNHIIPVLGARRCNTIQGSDWGALVRRMATGDSESGTAGYSQSLINRVIQIARGVTKFGKARGVWAQTEDPVLNLPMLKEARGGGGGLRTVAPGEVPTAAQVEDLAKHMGDFGLMARFAAATGLRWGELAALTNADLDLPERTVSVTKAVQDFKGALSVGSPKTRPACARSSSRWNSYRPCDSSRSAHRRISCFLAHPKVIDEFKKLAHPGEPRNFTLGSPPAAFDEDEDSAIGYFADPARPIQLVTDLVPKTLALCPVEYSVMEAELYVNLRLGGYSPKEAEAMVEASLA